LGVESSQKAALGAAASIGMTAAIISSVTRDASSTNRRETAEKPRVVSSRPGSPMIRAPLGMQMDMRCSDAPWMGSFEVRQKSRHLSMKVRWTGVRRARYRSSATSDA
jgi:hypothetical protein